MYASEPQPQRAPREPQRMHRTRPNVLTAASSQAPVAQKGPPPPHQAALFALRPCPSPGGPPRPRPRPPRAFSRAKAPARHAPNPKPNLSSSSPPSSVCAAVPSVRPSVCAGQRAGMAARLSINHCAAAPSLSSSCPPVWPVRRSAAPPALSRCCRASPAPAAVYIHRPLAAAPHTHSAVSVLLPGGSAARAPTPRGRGG